jgi:hypothetical protein
MVRRANIRAFKLPVIVLIDDQEAIEEERRDEAKGPVTLEEIKEYLSNSLMIDWDIEECGNEVGILSLNAHFEEITELPPEEREKVFKAMVDEATEGEDEEE